MIGSWWQQTLKDRQKLSNHPTPISRKQRFVEVGKSIYHEQRFHGVLDVSGANHPQSNSRLIAASRVWVGLRAANGGMEDHMGMDAAVAVVADMENRLNMYIADYVEFPENRKSALVEASATIFNQLAGEAGFEVSQSHIDEAVRASTSIAMALSRNVDHSPSFDKAPELIQPQGRRLKEQLENREQLSGMKWHHTIDNHEVKTELGGSDRKSYPTP